MFLGATNASVLKYPSSVPLPSPFEVNVLMPASDDGEECLGAPNCWVAGGLRFRAFHFGTAPSLLNLKPQALRSKPKHVLDLYMPVTCKKFFGYRPCLPRLV